MCWASNELRSDWFYIKLLNRNQAYYLNRGKKQIRTFEKEELTASSVLFCSSLCSTLTILIQGITILALEVWLPNPRAMRIQLRTMYWVKPCPSWQRLLIKPWATSIDVTELPCPIPCPTPWEQAHQRWLYDWVDTCTGCYLARQKAKAEAETSVFRSGAYLHIASLDYVHSECWWLSKLNSPWKYQALRGSFEATCFQLLMYGFGKYFIRTL